MRQRLRDWLQETHAPGFELVRHFLARFFDSDMVSASGDWLKLAIGLAAVLLSFSILALNTYSQRYAHLLNPHAGTPEQYLSGVHTDMLTFLALAMAVTALGTALQWQSLFPSLRDSLALAGLPVTPRQIFLAKFGALLLVFAVFVVALTEMPAMLFAYVIAGPWQENPSTGAIAIANFAALGGACVFVFFSLLALQGILLNILPGRLFTRLSLLAQAAVFIATLGTVPLVADQPQAAWWWPPVWFWNLRASILGAAKPGNAGAWPAAVLALTLPPAIAVLSYLLSYHRYRKLLLEAQVTPGRRRWEGAGAWLLDRWIRDPRQQAAFAFIWKSLARSRNHRMILLAYAGIAVGWTLSGLGDMPKSARHDAGTVGVLVVLVPLVACCCICLGLRYLFSLPVELRANWLFQLNEGQGRAAWFQAVQRFLTWCGIAPVYAATVPAAVAVFGPVRAAAASIIGLLAALLLFEFLFRRWQKLPFTCSYLPAKQEVWLSSLIYAMYLPVLAIVAQLLLFGSGDPAAFLAVLGFEAAVLWWMRRRRREFASENPLLYEEVLDYAVMTLGLQADPAARPDEPEAAIRQPAPEMFTGGLVASRGMLPREWREELDDEEHRPALWANLFEDVRYGLRLIRKNWLLSSAVVLTLTLGIGMNVSVLTVINGVALRPHVYKDPDSFARVMTQPRFQTGQRPVSYREYLSLQETSRSMRLLAAFELFGGQLEEDPSTTFGMVVSCNFFQVDGLDHATRGRLFVPDDCHAPGQAPVALISDDLWQSRFGSDPQIAGRVVRLNGRPVTVVGVVPKGTSGWSRPSRIWLPYTALPYFSPSRNFFTQQDDNLWLFLVGRLAPGFTRPQAQAELATLERRIDQLHSGRRTEVTVTDGSWMEEVEFTGQNLMVMGWVIGAINLVLLISCANVTTLLLSRAAARKREIAVRLSLGAPRIRLVRMLLTESLLLAALAGAASVYVAWRIPNILYEFVVKRPPDFPLPPDWRIFAYIAAVVFFTGCVCGLAPALESLKVDLTASLKGHVGAVSGAIGGAIGSSRMQRWLVAAQVAASLVMLVGAGLFAQAEYRILRTDPGYQPRKVLVAPLRFPEGATLAASRALMQAVMFRLQSVPGVQSVAYSDEPPLLGHDTVEVRFPARSSDATQTVDVYPASPGYFQTLGLSLLRGREFQETDRGAVAVSEALAKVLWPRQDPIGKLLQLPEGRVPVIGVARDVSPVRFGGSENPPAYRLTPLNKEHTFLMVRVENGTPALLAAVRSAIRSVSPEILGVSRILQDWIDEVTAVLWNLVTLIGMLGLVAIVLAATGIYGAVAFAVSQRTRDMGIRVALGATRWDIVREVFVGGGRPVMHGVFFGLWLSLVTATALKQTFKSTPIQLDSGDPMVYAAAAGLLLIAGLLAMLPPARRAATADPLESLRA
jgi:predicted permease